MTIHLGHALPHASRDQPGRRSGNPRWASARAVPIRSCSRWGLPCPFRCRTGGALLPHRFTLACRQWRRWRFVFCGTFPGVAPAGGYPAPCFRGARTFLPRSLSGSAAAVIRPAGSPELRTIGHAVKKRHMSISGQMPRSARIFSQASLMAARRWVAISISSFGMPAAMWRSG
jgi:hypothetical protein